MEEEAIIFTNGNLHVDNYGNSYLVQNKKIVGKNPAYSLSEVTITPKSPWKAAWIQSFRNPNWRQQYDMSSNFNAVTGGFLNQISPTQLGRNPNTKELQDYIDSLKDKQILNLLEHNTNAYGTEYVSNKPNAKLIKEALKYIGMLTPITIKGED